MRDSSLFCPNNLELFLDRGSSVSGASSSKTNARTMEWCLLRAEIILYHDLAAYVPLGAVPRGREERHKMALQSRVYPNSTDLRLTTVLFLTSI